VNPNDAAPGHAPQDPESGSPGPAPDHETQRRTYERAALIADAAGIGLWTRDLESGTLHWSDANRALYGLGQDDAPPNWAEYLARFVHPEDRERFVAEAALADTTGQPVRHMDYRVRTADGRERWIYSWSAREVRNGRRIGFGVNVDVTDRHVAEQERRQRERAEQARRAQSALLARVSHELRTPLNAVLGFADLLAHDTQRPLSASQAEQVDHIRAAGRHLLGLIDDLLGLASFEADTREPELQPVALADTVRQAVAWVRSLAERAQVEIELVEPLQGWVSADPRWLLQVTVNLLTNAIKYNRASGWVRVATPLREVNGSFQRGLVVRDSGHGIDRAQLSRLFEPFERLDAESRGIAGSGLGLAIVRRVVQRMGGEVLVHSVLGEGSEFQVWLRASTDVAAPRRAPLPPPATADSPPFDVLYIEDNATNRELVAAVLQLRPGVTLRSADDGASGLAAALAKVPDLVLLDIQLPDLDGLEVLRRLRAQPSLARCKIIALSANALPEDRREALEAGFDDYWTKPIDFSLFLQSIDSLAAA
jgi:PAS domain S-box-containing protein